MRVLLYVSAIATALVLGAGAASAQRAFVATQNSLSPSQAAFLAEQQRAPAAPNVATGDKAPPANQNERATSGAAIKK